MVGGIRTGFKHGTAYSYICDHNYEGRGGGHRDDVINLRSSGRIPIHRLESHRRRHRSRSGRAHLSFEEGSHDEKDSLEFGKSVSTKLWLIVNLFKIYKNGITWNLVVIARKIIISSLLKYMKRIIFFKLFIIVLHTTYNEYAEN